MELRANLFGLRIRADELNEYAYDKWIFDVRIPASNRKIFRRVVTTVYEDFKGHTTTTATYTLFGWQFTSKCITLPKLRLGKFKEVWRTIQPYPIHFWYSATDCDLYHVEYAVKYPNGWTAVREINEAYEEAEGTVSFRYISKTHYEHVKSEHKEDDIAARMMNY